MEGLVDSQFYHANNYSPSVLVLLCARIFAVLGIQTCLLLILEHTWFCIYFSQHGYNMLRLCWDRWNDLHPSLIHRNLDFMVLTVLLPVSLLYNSCFSFYDHPDCKRHACILASTLLCSLNFCNLLLHSCLKRSGFSQYVHREQHFQSSCLFLGNNDRQFQHGWIWILRQNNSLLHLVCSYCHYHVCASELVDWYHGRLFWKNLRDSRQ